MNITISANAVAWYGAIVATLSVLIAGYNAWRDRARLRIELKEVFLAEDLPPFKAHEPLISVEVSNIGRRPIHLSGLPYVQLYSDKKGAGIVFRSSWQPSDTVEEGKCATLLVRKGNLELNQIKRVVIRDQANRKWFGKVKKP